MRLFHFSDDPAAVRRSAKASRAWTDTPMQARWVKTAER